MDPEQDSEHVSASDHHSSEDNTVLLVIETSERIFAGDYVLRKGKYEGSRVWEQFELFIIAMTKMSLE